MERAVRGVNHSAAHWDRVAQYFIGEIELLERVNAAGRKREINRAAADRVAGARVRAALEEFDLVAAPAEETGEQSPGQSAAHESKLGAHAGTTVDASRRLPSPGLAIHGLIGTGSAN